MLRIKDTEVHGLDRALRASGNAKTYGEIFTKDIATDRDITRGEHLGQAPVGSAHDHFLVGIQATFDILYPQYWTIEAERYHNFEILTSQSKMHKLTAMTNDPSFPGMFNKYVDKDIIEKVKHYADCYNSTPINGTWEGEARYHWFMKTVSNLPMGFELWMTCSLSYLQIKTIVLQRRGHKLAEDWGPFCDWALDLPMFKELTGIEFNY